MTDGSLRVDILMATYNGAEFIGAQIDSIVAQDYQNWRLLISDDGSSDETVSIVQSYVERDERVRLVSSGERHGGAKENFFSLLPKTTSPYVMLCDQDDVWFSDKVSQSLVAIRDVEARYGADRPLLVVSDMVVVDRDLRVIAPSFSEYSRLVPQRHDFMRCIAQSIGAGCSFMMNSALVRSAERCEDLDSVIMHDWWITLVASATGRISYLPVPLSSYRQHGSNTEGAREFDVRKRLTALLGRGAERISDYGVRELLAIRQAACFVAAFRDDMSVSDRRSAELFIQSMSGGPVQNVARLVRSRAWKVGARRMGQVLCSLRGRAIVSSLEPGSRLAPAVDA